MGIVNIINLINLNLQGRDVVIVFIVLWSQLLQVVITMLKKSSLSEEDLKEIEMKGVSAWTGFFKEKKIIVLFKNGTRDTFYFTGNWGYRKLSKFLRKLEMKGDVV